MAAAPIPSGEQEVETWRDADRPPAELTTADEGARLRPPLVDDPVKVGLLLPLSGRAAELGQALRDAALLKLFELGTGRIVLLPADTRGTAEGAEAAARRVLAEGERLILPGSAHRADGAGGCARRGGGPLALPAAVTPATRSARHLLRKPASK